MTRPQDVVTLKRDVASTVRRYREPILRNLFDGKSYLDAPAEVTLAKLTLDVIDYADPVFVSGNVIDELRNRVKRSEPFKLGTVTPFTPRGFVWFERAVNLGLSVVPGKDSLVYGLSWGEGLVPTVQTGGMVRSGDGWRQLGPDESQVAMKPGMAVMVWTTPPPEAREAGMAAVPAGYGLAAYEGWFRPEDVTELMRYGDDHLVMFDGARGEIATGSNIITLAHTLWAMLEERVLVRAKVPLGRKSLRTAKRAGLDDRFVTTIHLRAREYVGETYEGRQHRGYSHQFPVRGHYRILKKGTPEERRVFVKSYVKGPRDAPFVARERVYSLDT